MKILVTICLVFIFALAAYPQQRVGVKAQNFVQENLAGESVELEQLEGKVVVIAFWSTKCQICVAEMPRLNKLVEKYDGKDVEFLGLTMNSPKMVKNFLKNRKFKFNIIPNSFGVVLKYADRDSGGRLVMKFPAYYVVDKKGGVTKKAFGFGSTEGISNEIDKLL